MTGNKKANLVDTFTYLCSRLIISKDSGFSEGFRSRIAKSQDVFIQFGVYSFGVLKQFGRMGR